MNSRAPKKGNKISPFASSLPPLRVNRSRVRAEKRSHSFNRFELSRVCGIPCAIHILKVKRREREEI